MADPYPFYELQDRPMYRVVTLKVRSNPASRFQYQPELQGDDARSNTEIFKGHQSSVLRDAA